MNREERRNLQALVSRADDRSAQADAVLKKRRDARQALRDAIKHLQRSVFPAHRDGSVAWQVLPITAETADRMGDVLAWDARPEMTDVDLKVLRSLAEDLPAHARAARSLLGLRRLLSTSATKATAARSAAHLADHDSWAEREGLSARLDAFDLTVGRVAVHTAHDLPQGRVPLGGHVPQLAGRPTLVDVREFAALEAAIGRVRQAQHQEARYRDAALRAGNAVREAATAKVLAEMPLDRLREATRDRLRTAPLANAGFTTVLEVLKLGERVTALPGIGAMSATQLAGAARTLWQTTFDEMPARIDIRDRSKPTTRFLQALREWDAARALSGNTTLVARADELAPLTDRLKAAGATHVALYPTGPTPDPARLIEDVKAVCEGSAGLGASATGAAGGDVWDDFTSRPADYFALLSELGLNPEDESKSTGDLPDEIVRSIRDLTLKTDHLRVAALRGYQSFAARFALVQRKVIIGDEMGLGKTVEALAVLAHLSAAGESHFVVVCPAAVVTNWTREVSTKSTLAAHRMHGPERDQALRSWTRRGGVAVTTFETLARFQSQMLGVQDLACVVVDEAHYVKNPEAKRSRRIAALIERAPRAILLTGTPLENKLEEFAALVGYLQPDLVVDSSELSPRRFRRQVAPAYLRRNQEDVLNELPELVEVDEVVPLSSADHGAYRRAVEEGSFAAMRQAAMLQGGSSQKLSRLLEIVAEAEDNGRRVIVFSHFLEVLRQVAAVLPGKVFGPLTGSTPAVQRQRLVDEFSAARSGAVLVAQIMAGGVGLNIQAASVIVICEPQLKPTIEWQAVARAHRMGQLDSVQVHRLLSEEGVDMRITQILARKSALFADFARQSATAQSAPEAFDVSEAELTREIVAEERQRLLAQK